MSYRPLEKRTPHIADLWIVPFASEIYKKINWWTGFMASEYLAPKKLRQGETYLLGTHKDLPNKWTLIHSESSGSEMSVTGAFETWAGLGHPTVNIFLDSEKQQDQWSLFLDDPIYKKRVNFPLKMDPFWALPPLKNQAGDKVQIERLFQPKNPFCYFESTDA